MEDRYRPRTTANATPPPFWARIPAIALYPLRGVAGWSVAAVGASSLLAAIPLLGTVITVVVAIIACAYAFEILQASANGQPDPPGYGYHSDYGLVMRYVLLALLQIATIVLVAVFTRSQPLILLAVAITVLVIPASVIVLVLERSLLSALNPLHALDIVTRIGWPYLAAYALLFVIQGSALTAIYWAINYLPELLSPLVLSIANSWATFASCHLLGYLVYQHHEALGFVPEMGAADAHSDPDQHLLDEAEEQVRNGQLDGALQTLRRAVRTRAVTLPVLDLYQRLLCKAGHPRELDDHTHQYLLRLLSEKQERSALNLLREALQREPERVPTDEAHAVLLLERCRLSGQKQLTLDLLLAMLHTWPHSADSAQRALDAALLLTEHYDRENQARELLQQALEKSDNHAQREKIETAMKALT
jgi:hypothetical protein